MVEGEELRFTGNWFIDAGILGFVNLMGEVYEFKDNNTLLTLPTTNPEKTLDAFYYAYIRYHMRETIKKFLNKVQPKGRSKKAQEIFKRKEETLILIEQFFQRVRFEGIKNVDRREIRKQILHENEELRKLFVNSFEEFNSELKKNTSQNKKTPVETVKARLGIILEIPFFQNLNFLNPSKNIKGGELKVLESFEKLIYEKKIKTKGTHNVLDKTISKFMFAEEEFPNESYGKLPTVEDLEKFCPLTQIYLLSFPVPFVQVSYRGYQSNVLFYTPSFSSTYNIMKRLKTKIKMARNNSHDVFKITWGSVIDEIVESKSKFSLEHMYLIEYQGLDRQSLINVEYIGIPKLHASIILDDDIRDALNTSLSFGDSNIWLLEHFLRQKPLFPIIVGHIWNSLKKKSYTNWKASLYSLAIDAKLKASNTETGIFGNSFFERPKRAAIEVKDYYKDMMQVTRAIKEISGSVNRKNLVYPLLSAIRRHNRNAFVNTLLKALLQSKDKNKATMINNYLFRRILSNDESWEDFALALIIGLIGGGEDVSSGQSVVED